MCTIEGGREEGGGEGGGREEGGREEGGRERGREEGGREEGRREEGGREGGREGGEGGRKGGGRMIDTSLHTIIEQQLSNKMNLIPTGYLPGYLLGHSCKSGKFTIMGSRETTCTCMCTEIECHESTHPSLLAILSVYTVRTHTISQLASVIQDMGFPTHVLTLPSYKLTTNCSTFTMRFLILSLA